MRATTTPTTTTTMLATMELRCVTTKNGMETLTLTGLGTTTGFIETCSTRKLQSHFWKKIAPTTSKFNNCT